MIEAVKSFFFPLKLVGRFFADLGWWIRYRVDPRHKYTTIKLNRLKPGYYDTDTLMFYALFELFEAFMERQLTDPHHVWEYTEEYYDDWMGQDEIEEDMSLRNAVWREMNEIYNWWVNVYPNRMQSLPPLPILPEEWGSLAPFKQDFENEDLVKEWDLVTHERNAARRRWKDEDKEMMIRLIEIMPVLWD